jgi:hypothetical protein
VLLALLLSQLTPLARATVTAPTPTPTPSPACIVRSDAQGRMLWYCPTP